LVALATGLQIPLNLLIGNARDLSLRSVGLQADVAAAGRSAWTPTLRGLLIAGRAVKQAAILTEAMR